MILEMKKITIFGILSQRDQLLRRLIKLGVMQIDNASDTFDGLSTFKNEAFTRELLALENDLAAIANAIKYLSVYDQAKKGLFPQKRIVGEKEHRAYLAKRDEILGIVHTLSEYTARLNALKQEENRLHNHMAVLAPWMNYDIQFAVKETRYTYVAIGTVPSVANFSELRETLSETTCAMQTLSEDKDYRYVSLIYLKAEQDAVLDILNAYGFSKVEFSEFSSTPKSAVEQMQARLEEISIEKEKIELDIKRFAKRIDDLKWLYDTLAFKRDRKEICENLVKTESTFLINGWIKEQDAEKVKADIESHFTAAVVLESPAPDEEFPVELKNPKLASPFEAIIEMYSLPKASRRFDPNVIMAPFYFIFFGLMLSDAAYGLVLSIACFFLLWKYKPSGTMKKMLGLFGICGISTFLWGALFGGWFGNAAEAITSGRFVIQPLWFNPLNEPMKLLIWSFGLGLLHIYTALGINMYLAFKDGDWKKAIFDNGFWIITLIGLPLYASDFMLGMANMNLSAPVSAIITKIGLYLTLFGAVGLILTQGRAAKNIFVKLFKGVSSLYDITGYLSDVLSYSRLLALGLSTGVIAMVVNTMGSLAGLDNIFGILLFAVVFVFGHLLNIAINVLGAYVHTSRLQYVEFFSKFYEGGGKAFVPFEEKTKYITLKD